MKVGDSLVIVSGSQLALLLPLSITDWVHKVIGNRIAFGGLCVCSRLPVRGLLLC